MKKIISLLVCAAMLALIAVPASFASKTDSDEDGKPGPVLFVTGIGQTRSYVLDENGTRDLPYMGENYKYSSEANLFIVGTDGLKNPVSIANAAVVLAQLIHSLVFNGKYNVSYDRICRLMSDLLKNSIIDEQGDLPDCVFTPVYRYPLSEYAKHEKDRFQNSIPCFEEIEEIGADRAFCYNYAPFASIKKIAAGLDEYIENVVLEYYPGEKITIVPMSMGAAIVSQYLNDYGDKDRIGKVISVVGCWEGSDILVDLIEKRYSENSAELFYGGLMAQILFGNSDGIENLLLRWPKKENWDLLIDDLLSALCDEFVLKTPSLLSLIPSGDYQRIRDKYLTRPGYEYVLEEMDEYHEVQSTVRERMLSMQEKYGTDFYFISGYDLKLGEGSGDFPYLEFLYSANKVNSDEIINIESTTLGATSAPAHTQLSDEYLASADAKYISPEKSVDLSTALYPDRCWLFEEQFHDLKWNNTALRLIVSIAKGDINSVKDHADVYPQFNLSRDLHDLTREYIPQISGYVNQFERHNILGRNVSSEKEFENYFNDTLDEGEDENVLENAENVRQAQGLIAEYKALKAQTINDPERDAAFTQKVLDFLVEIGFSEEEEEEEESFSDRMLSRLNEKAYSKYGAKGFFD